MITIANSVAAPVCRRAAQLLTSGVALLMATLSSAAAQNAIVVENQQPGVDPAVWYVDGPGDANIQGFATDMSVDRGETVHWKIDTDATAYHIDVYRLGWYQGLGARLVGTGVVTATLPQIQPAPIYDPVTAMTDCGNWAESAHWDVPANAVSGIYVAKLIRDDATPGTSHVTFIVRDDSGTSELLFQFSDATWQAYNVYGGASLYPALGGSAPGFNHATKVSYNRPFDVRHADGSPGDNVFAAEYAMVRWLERNGYDVSYFSSLDTDRRGSLLLQHQVFLSVGHDEYWSGPQRANVTAARDAGVHLAFFSGNEVYWRTRYEPSIDGSGTPYRTLVCYKEGTLGENGCGGKCDPSAEWTGLWRDGCSPTYSVADACLPENSLTGQIGWDGTIGAIQVTDAFKELRFWRNTSVATLAPGQSVTLGASSLGSEWDWEQYDASYPMRRIKLSSTFLNGRTHHLTIYRADSGALVFGAGTIQWSWGLDSFHTFAQEPTNADMQQATVNLFADLGVTPESLQPGMVPAAASSDMTPPASVITSPTLGATTALNSTLMIQGTATDTGGGVVAGVELSFDDGVTWHAATGTDPWSYAWAPAAEGAVTIRSRAFDDSLNIETPGTFGDPNVTAVTVTAPMCPCTVFLASEVPPGPLANDGSAIEVGMRFRADVDGTITALRYYKPAGATGIHIGNLWTGGGTLLATATFTGETASGWQQVALSTPVPIAAGTTYVVSYFSPSGDYVGTNHYFTQQVGTGSLHGLADGFDGPNGVYLYSATSAFPTDTFNSSNYYADAVLDTGLDLTPPTVTAHVPSTGASGVPIDTLVTVTFNESLDANTVDTTTVELRDPANMTVPATVGYDDGTRTATLTPTTPLVGLATYTVIVRGGAVDPRIKDLAGNALTADVTWTFTTAATVAGPFTVFSPSEVPPGPLNNDANALELGMKFRTDVDGLVTALRYYKAAGTTGVHTGNLWTATGTSLASQDFTGETASGWQEVQLTTPVPITAGTTYVVSYFSPSGDYVSTLNYFNQPIGLGLVHGLANGTDGPNGLFTYSATSTFPNQSFNASNYYADVVFTAHSHALAVQTVGNGTVAEDPDQPLHLPGTSVELTASADVGHSFAGWSGDATGTANPLTVLMDADKDITATFVAIPIFYALTTTAAGNGNVARDPDLGSYQEGSSVMLTASAAVGHSFVGWSGDAAGTSNPMTVVMDADKDITATFAIDTHTLTVGTVGDGSVTKDPDQPDYTFGSSVALTAIAEVGHTFTGWSGDASGTANPLTVLIDGDKNITATFVLDTHTLTVGTVGDGSVARNPDQPDYPYGSSVELTATADVGHTFTGWSGDAVGTANPLTVLIDGDKNITATFVLDTHTLTLGIVGNGTVGKSPDLPEYPYGTSVVLTPSRDGGQVFAGWSGDASGSDNPLTVLMDGDKNITATFTANGQLPASNTSVGRGCYTLSNSFYQYLATPAAAAAALTGQSLTLTPAGSTYEVSYGGGTYVPPSGLAVAILVGIDDGQETIVPSTAVPYPGGSTPSLSVHSNGIIGVAPITMPDAPDSHTPTSPALLDEATTAWYCWHDFTLAEGGTVLWEEVGGVLYVTWLGAESYPDTSVNASTFQFQFDLEAGPTFGVVRYAWDTIAGVGTGQTTGRAEQTLIGWSPGGPSLDAGSIDLATGTPLSTWDIETPPLTLAVTPAPVSDSVDGTVLTYTVSNIPEAAPASGLHIAAVFLSFTPLPGGLDLGVLLGAPGCDAHLPTADIVVNVGPVTADVESGTFLFPPGIPYGVSVTAQAISLVVPGSLPNGQNAGGVLTSNAVTQFVSDY